MQGGGCKTEMEQSHEERQLRDVEDWDKEIVI
jgi:hypothetical protein